MTTTQTTTATPTLNLHLTGANSAMIAAPARVIPHFKYADLLDKGPFNDWRDDLQRDGYVVIPNVITEERAAELRGQAFSWL